jgi:hypothetical protein
MNIWELKPEVLKSLWLRSSATRGGGIISAEGLHDCEGNAQARKGTWVSDGVGVVLTCADSTAHLVRIVSTVIHIVTHKVRVYAELPVTPEVLARVLCNNNDRQVVSLLHFGR